MSMAIKKGWKELKEEIIDTRKCCLCGNCAAFCDAITITPSGPREENALCTEMATCRDGFGTCYNLCPETSKDYFNAIRLDAWVHGLPPEQAENPFEHDLEVLAARYAGPELANSSDNGTMAIGLLLAGLECGEIDGIIATHILDPPGSIICDKETLLSSGLNPFFTNAPMALVGDAINQGLENIALLGSGCEIKGLRKLQNHHQFDYEVHELVSLVIGTFCYFKPKPDRFQKYLGEKNISLDAIHGLKFDASGFQLVINTENGSKSFPMNELYDNTPRGSCFSCSDMTAQLADISIGNLDALEGWDILIIRTSRGKDAVARALDKGYIETRAINGIQDQLVKSLTRNSMHFSDVLAVETLGTDLKKFTLRAPVVARAYEPGQFIMLWIPDVDFLPMGISKVDGDVIEITVEKIGEGTATLFEMKEGNRMGIRGPFGRGWDLNQSGNYLLVGGGVGTSALLTARDHLLEKNTNIQLLSGSKSSESQACGETGDDICLVTEDGSLGEKGMVTKMLEPMIEKHAITHVLTCGPEPMMKAVLDACTRKAIKLQASLERKMKCCVGLCGTCCIGPENDIPVCKRGPVFTQEELGQIHGFGNYKK